MFENVQKMFEIFIQKKKKINVYINYAERENFEIGNFGIPNYTQFLILEYLLF